MKMNDPECCTLSLLQKPSRMKARKCFQNSIALSIHKSHMKTKISHKPVYNARDCGNKQIKWDSQHLLRFPLGRAIAQVVSRRILTAAARVRAQVSSCGICGRQRGTGAGFHRELRVSPATLIIYHPVLVQKDNWWETYQVHSVPPHPKKLKIN
jgi:hypothetical protein